MYSKYEKFTDRIVLILKILNDGSSFSIQELSQEFSVSARTIQRDLQRLSFLPIECHNGRYSLASYSLGMINFENLRDFLKLCGIQDLFPNLEKNTLHDLFNPKLNHSLLIKPALFAKVENPTFEKLQIATLQNQIVTFLYKDTERQVQPYKLINHLGVWYLLGIQEEKIKSFAIEKIKLLQVLPQTFKKDKKILQEIQENKFSFLSLEKFEIILDISTQVSTYFLNRTLLPNMKIIETHKEGLQVSVQTSYEEEILRIVQEWMPHLTILSPASTKEKLIQRLQSYLSQVLEQD